MIDRCDLCNGEASHCFCVKHLAEHQEKMKKQGQIEELKQLLVMIKIIPTIGELECSVKARLKTLEGVKQE